MVGTCGLNNSLINEDDNYMRDKSALIISAVNSDPPDLSSLRLLAVSSYGLVNDHLRKLVWPKLLGVDSNYRQVRHDASELMRHRDYRQVVLDVSRSLRRFPPGMQDEERLTLQDQCVRIIMQVLVNHEELYYYQGYHDICVTLIMVLGEELASVILDRMSISHLRFFMDENMERTQFLLSFLYPILGHADLELRCYMERAELNTIFCLSWLITWYGHVLGDIKDIVRLFDFFFVTDPIMPMYLATAIVIYRREEVLGMECEMCFIHSLLSDIPDSLPFEHLIERAKDLYLKYPPGTLDGEAYDWYSARASLKTRRPPQSHSRSPLAFSAIICVAVAVVAALAFNFFGKNRGFHM